MLNLFTLLIFLFVFILVYVLRAFSLKRLRQEAIEDKLRQFKLRMEQESPSMAQETDDSITLASESYSGPYPKLWRLYHNAARDVERLGWKQNLRTRVLIVAAVSFAGAALVARMTPYPGITVAVGSIILFCVICAVAYRKTMDKYLEELAQSLPEAIDSIARICRSGVPAQSSFAIASENLRGPLVQELLALDHWLRLGVPVRRALQESAQRVPVREYRFFRGHPDHQPGIRRAAGRHPRRIGRHPAFQGGTGHEGAGQDVRGARLHQDRGDPCSRRSDVYVLQRPE